MNETYYLNLIEQNTNNANLNATRILAEIQNLKAIEYNTQAIMTSGDNMIAEKLNAIGTWQVTMTMAIVFLLLLNFIERCLK